MSVISEKYQSDLFPLSDDWQDDVRSSLYFQIWCSWVSDSGLVVWSPGYDSDDLGSIPGRVNFLKFQIWIPLIFSHVQGSIYTHLDWNYHNHRGLVGVGDGLLTVRFSVRFLRSRIPGTGHPVEASRCRTCQRQWTDHPLNLCHAHRESMRHRPVAQSWKWWLKNILVSQLSSSSPLESSERGFLFMLAPTLRNWQHNITPSTHPYKYFELLKPCPIPLQIYWAVETMPCTLWNSVWDYGAWSAASSGKRPGAFRL